MAGKGRTNSFAIERGLEDPDVIYILGGINSNTVVYKHNRS